MATLSPRLSDALLLEVDLLADRTGIGRAESVRRALVRRNVVDDARLMGGRWQI